MNVINIVWKLNNAKIEIGFNAVQITFRVATQEYGDKLYQLFLVSAYL